MKLQLTYFALLREQRGLSTEEFTTALTTARELYEFLKRQYHFSLSAERVRVALDDEFVSWDSILRDGQRVAFIPPVAGG